MAEKTTPPAKKSAIETVATARPAVPADDVIEIYINANGVLDYRYLNAPGTPAGMHQSHGKAVVRWACQSEFAIVFSSNDCPVDANFYRGDARHPVSARIVRPADPQKAYEYAVVVFGSGKPFTSDPRIIIT